MNGCLFEMCFLNTASSVVSSEPLISFVMDEILLESREKVNNLIGVRQLGGLLISLVVAW